MNDDMEITEGAIACLAILLVLLTPGLLVILGIVLLLRILWKLLE